MSQDQLPQTCSADRWALAQKDELYYWATQGPDGDDWNDWWFDKFDGYRCVKWRAVKRLLEVGCGPYARNTRGIMRTYFENKPVPEIVLNDPLIYEYAVKRLYVRTLIDALGCRPNGLPLEELIGRGGADALICVNVLNHVRDIDACFHAMHTCLAKGGYLIFGNELTNAADAARCPAILTDSKHPVFFDLPDIQKHLDNYETVLMKTLPTTEGRNPAAHYSTLIYVGRKL